MATTANHANGELHLAAVLRSPYQQLSAKAAIFYRAPWPCGPSWPGFSTSLLALPECGILSLVDEKATSMSCIFCEIVARRARTGGSCSRGACTRTRRGVFSSPLGLFNSITCGGWTDWSSWRFRGRLNHLDQIPSMGTIGRKLRRNARRQQGTTTRAPDARPLMSEVLVDVAYPLVGALRLPDHEADYRFALDLAAVLWSVSRVPDDAERQRLLEEILHPKAGPLEPEAFDALVAVYRRSRERHPKEKRLILGVHFYQGTDGRYHTDVASL